VVVDGGGFLCMEHWQPERIQLCVVDADWIRNQLGAFEGGAMKLWTVTIENEIVVAAETAEDAKKIAERILLSDVGDFGYEAEAMTSLPFGWEGNASPFSKSGTPDSRSTSGLRAAALLSMCVP
jgi:hypothetical protein